MKKEIIRLLNSVSFTDEETISNYGGDNSYYQHDLKVFNDNMHACRHNLETIKRFSIVEFRKACNDTWGGRLNFVGNSYHLEYTAGQFYTLELPQAVGAVLLTYIHDTTK